MNAPQFTPGPWADLYEAASSVLACSDEFMASALIGYASDLRQRSNAAFERLRAAIAKVDTDQGACPVCNGDCAGANPPVTNCPLAKARGEARGEAA